METEWKENKKRERVSEERWEARCEATGEGGGEGGKRKRNWRKKIGSGEEGRLWRWK